MSIRRYNWKAEICEISLGKIKRNFKYDEIKFVF